MPERFNSFDFPELEGFKKVLSWLIDERTEALIELTDPILPYIRSIIIEKEDRIIISDEGGPANYENIFSNLNFINLLDPYNIRQLSYVPENITISNEDYKTIKEKFLLYEKKAESMKNGALALYKASEPLWNYRKNLDDIIKDQKFTDVNKLRKYENETDNFKKKVKKTDWNKFQQKEYTRFENAMKTGKIAYANLLILEPQDEAFYKFPFVFHEDFKTDPERYVAPFFICHENIDSLYADTFNLFKACKEKSGFLRGPPQELKNKTISTLNEFMIKALAAVSGHDIASNSYTDHQRVDMKKKPLLKMLEQKREPKKLIHNLLDIINGTNYVHPVFQKISVYA